jgi:hypothetical protein
MGSIKLSKHLLLTFLLFQWSVLSQAQIIDNRLNIYMGYSTGITSTRETVTKQGIVLTSLMGKLETWNGMQLKGFYMLSPSLGAGLALAGSSANTISGGGQELYNNSVINHNYLAGMIRIQNHKPTSGLFNRFYFFGAAGPAVGYSFLTLGYPIMDVVYGDSGRTLAMNSSDFTPGFVLIGGAELIIHRLAGIYLGYSFDIFHVNSPYYPDRVFTKSIVEAGIFFRFQANKRFYYH